MLNDHVQNPIGIIAKKNPTHLEEHSLVPAEQKGCYPGSKKLQGSINDIKGNI
jgi:hypothetical protein